ncbi:MAG: hypothetical protein WBA61_13435 [Aequorivita sp.]
MGEIAIGFRNYLERENLKSQVIYLQDIALQKINDIFISQFILNLHFNHEIGIGERGNYDGIENHLFSIKFDYIKNYHINFFLYYDQLEYYISKNNKTLKECNLEDFWEDNIMIEKFLNYLKTDMKKLGIPYQN